MDELLARIAAIKAELDRLRPLAPRALENLEHAYDLELTYTSNAIEGNTLTQAETSLVIDQGITIGGKKLKDHLEASELACQGAALGEYDLRNLHALLLKRSDPPIAGRYATSGRFVNTDSGRHAFPSPAEVPALMGDFVAQDSAHDARDRVRGASPLGRHSSIQRRQRPHRASADESRPSARRISSGSRATRRPACVRPGSAMGAERRGRGGFKTPALRAPGLSLGGDLAHPQRGGVRPEPRSGDLSKDAPQRRRRPPIRSR